MKFYMSYWSGGYQQIPQPYVIDYHRLSAHYLKKHYGEVHLITDSVGKEHLNGVGYTTISTELDSLPANLNWALGKLYSYRKLAQIGDPFLHVDYDVFAAKPFPANKLSSTVLVQSVEKIFPPDRWYDVDTFYNLCPNKGYCNRDDSNDISYNTGIFGGNDLTFIYNYANSAYELSIDPSNQIGYQQMNINAFGTCWYLPTIFLEQYYLYQCAKHFDVSITTLLEGGDYDKLWFESSRKTLEYFHVADVGNSVPKNHQKIVEMVQRKLIYEGVIDA